MARGEAVDLEVCSGVREGVMPYIDDKAKVVQEICTQNGLLDVGSDENPPKIVAQTKVEGAGAHIKGHNLRTIHCLQTKGAMWM